MSPRGSAPKLELFRRRVPTALKLLWRLVGGLFVKGGNASVRDGEDMFSRGQILFKERQEEKEREGSADKQASAARKTKSYNIQCKVIKAHVSCDFLKLSSAR